MKYIYLVKFIAIVGIACITTDSWAQTCTFNGGTVQNPVNWFTAANWTCTEGASAPPSVDFTGNIIINGHVAFENNSNSTIEITFNKQIKITVNTGFSINMGDGKGAVVTFIDPLSTIDLLGASPAARLRGTSANSRLCFVSACCRGPYEGNGNSANLIEGPRTLSSSAPNCGVINNALPVTLLSFTAKPEGDRVQLAWATTSEQNAARFVVERSADLGEYMSVGQVAAKGTRDGRQNYGLTDMQPLPGVNYYRLRQIDHNGDSQTFKPVSAIVNSDEIVAAVYPNPADANRIHLRLRNADNAVVRLLTLAGQPVEGKLERMLDEADLVLQHPLQAGMYLLEVQTNGQKRISKVLIR